ncbi:MAG: hypothetical protein HYV07_15615 [Deltaproteobacteria bacterium]|nr:hypothetical protein [Deltaproteobacteria bacterium]
MKLGRALSLSLFFTGCVVEPRAADQPDAGFFDAHVLAPDAAAPRPTCGHDAATCSRGFVCKDGACVDRTACAQSLDCHPDRVCSFLERENVGSCRPRPDACLEGACPEGRHCGRGFCGPALVEDGTLRAACAVSTDCAPAGICAHGACSSCSELAPCATGLTCLAGRCVEPPACRLDSDCIGSNLCLGGRCVRNTSGCVPDPENDAPGTATVLYPSRSARSICGNDVDRYTFMLAENEGARIVVTSTPSEATISARVTSDADLETTRLSLPGHSIIEIAAGEERELDLVVESLDTSGSYVLDLETGEVFCSADELDLYGDEDPATAPVVPNGFLATLKACVNDVDVVRLALESRDALSVDVAIPSSTGTRLEVGVEDRAGVALASASRSFETQGPLVSEPVTSRGLALVTIEATSAPTLGQSYDLSIDRRPGSRIDACTNPERLTGSQTIDLSTTVELGRAGCLEGRGRVLRVDERPGSLLRASVRAIAGSPGSLGVARLDGCTDARALDCELGTAPAIEWVATGTPTYVLVASTSTSGVAELSLGVNEVDNFTCADGRAAPIIGSGVVSVDTLGATDTVSGSDESMCLFTGDGVGADRFFAVSLAARHRAVLELSGTPGGLLWAATDCLSFAETCTAAAVIERVPATLVLAPRDATNYLVAVDGLTADDAGSRSLRTIFDPECVGDDECGPEKCDDYVCRSAPANDACDGAALTLVRGHVEVTGSLGAAADDFAATCGGGGQPDVVYQLDVPASLQSLRARVADASFDAILSIRRAPCAGATAELACEDDEHYPTDLRPDLTLESPAAGTYFFIVDSFYGEGAFTLSIDTR